MDKLCCVASQWDVQQCCVSLVLVSISAWKEPWAEGGSTVPGALGKMLSMQ